MTGRPPFVPTDRDRKQVETLASIGINEKDIADLIGVSNKTLRKYFMAELKKSPVRGSLKVKANLYRMATEWPPRAGTTLTAAVKWLERYGGAEWKREGEGGAVEVPQDGSPVRIVLPDNGRD